ncbi:MAG TPA: rhamnogalacturonan lyase, partial [Polyangiaceae bacterium]|nr:rhamnogalacturonan lyase [Polyangiaceae bacterium]
MTVSRLTISRAGGVLAVSLLAACGSSGADEGGAPGAGASGGNAASGGAGAAAGGAAQAGTAMLGGSAAVAGSTPSGGNVASGGSAAMAGSAQGGSSASTAGSSGGGTGPSEPASCAAPTTGHYQMEDLDRGLIAVKVDGGVYVGWRMQGYEYDETASNVSYDLYRDGQKLATVADSTNYLDKAGTASSSYTVRAIVKGSECALSAPVKPLAESYLSIPLTPPATGPHGGTYSANDGSVGDLDGDGQLDVVLKWDPSNAQDNSKAGVTDDVFVDGYTLSGTRLFRIDLGPNIRAGAHYTQLSVYDFDGDGKAEIACKTAPGTKDGTGKALSLGPAADDDDTKEYRNADGYILTGPEYLT